ncbi:mechanosensitive ion channel domain-containing protein [Uliginosibacterium sp. sgz301328]|uniref:mechanosensitive ion channel family protein n=1 Tax=Uliginosibacterium sp. sgz301328 TaxID=3243764 RepID=UPI00359ED54F
MKNPLHALICTLLVLLLHTVAGPASGASSSSSSSSLAVSSAPAETTLAAIVSALDAPDRLASRAARVSEQIAPLKELAPKLVQQDVELRALLTRIERADGSTAGAGELIDMQTAILNDDVTLSGMIERLRSGVGDIESLLADLQQERDKWAQRSQLAKQLEASPALQARIDSVHGTIDDDIRALRPRRDALLVLLGNAVELRSRVEEVRARISARRLSVSQALREAEAEPIWRIYDAERSHLPQVRAEWSAQGRQIKAYFELHGTFLALLALAIFGLTLWLMRRAREISLHDVTTLPIEMERCRRVMHRPFWVALLVTLLYVALSAPRGPIAFYDLLWLFVPLPAAALTVSALGPAVRTSVWALAIALLASPFRSLLEFAPGIDRLVMAAQAILVGAALWHDLRKLPGNVGTPRKRRALKTIAWLALGALAVSLYTNIVGFVGVAATLRTGVLGTLGFAVTYTAAFYATLGLGLVALRTPAARGFHIVQRRRATLEHALFRIQATLCVIGVLVGTMFAFGLYDTVPGAVSALMALRLDVGEASISLGALITVALCLVGTWVLMGVVRVLLEDEIMPRLNLSDGVPYAISALTRYALALLGFMFALAAAGIDMTKLTIVAGAVGVGVGFGLQAIVNNFVSGLILLLERPIHVGDTVETDSASGVVQHIGIRATTIRTFQGGDVIVPNGNLLSKDLLNWTLSNRRRRIEVEIGAGYGSNPEEVKRHLVEAARAHPDILSIPAPLALFVGFGDNSLDFRLLAWVNDTDVAGGTASAIRESILKRFSDAGIEIPFPQRDVWIRQPHAPGPSLPSKPDTGAEQGPSTEEPTGP